MSTDARKRQRQKLKRQKKRVQLQRIHGGSPYRRIGEGEIVACYINSNWREDGMISIYALRRRPDGGHTLASFLIDVWCIGLKDVHGELDVSPTEFREDIIGRVGQNLDLERVDVAFARRMVAGAVRFSRQNGFRLPPKWERWARVLGDLGDWQTADLSDFGVDGGLRFVGNIADLHKRLIGCTVDQFLARQDVHYVLGPLPSAFDDDDDEFVDPDADPDPQELVFKATDIITTRILERVRQWCFANRLAPSPRLPEVIRSTIGTFCMQVLESGDREQDLAKLDDCEREFLALTSGSSSQDTIDFQRAMDQLRGFMLQHPTPETFKAALGVRPI